LKYTNNSSGNVLFLILIAVALFAALSYAVTSSTRSGGGDASRESNDVKAASLLQYTSSLRAAIQRMIVGGVDITNLNFTAPSNFASCTNTAACVFHPSGGGVIYQNNSLGGMGLGIFSGSWVFSQGNSAVLNVGTNGVGGEDLIAFSLDIDKGICEAINKKLGLPYSPVPVSGSQAYSPEEISANAGGVGITLSALTGKYEGCYLGNDTDEEYVYFSVLVAR
jgi:hypothetical protein